MTAFFRKYLLAPVLICAFCMMTAAPAGAADIKTFTILPFKLHGSSEYKHLSESIQSMLASRLFWQGHFEPLENNAGIVENGAAAEKARAAVGANYVVWGSITVVSKTSCSLDLWIQDASGKVLLKPLETTPEALHSSLKQVAESIHSDLFALPKSGSQPAASGNAGARNQMNPQLVQNQNTPQRPYMNPNFRYAGAREDESRLRSQTLPFAAVGMEVCDADGDGRNEIFLISDHKIYAYRFNGEQLSPLGEYSLPMTQQLLNIRSIDLDGSRKPKLVVSAHDTGDSPVSRILSFDGKNFKEEAKTLQFFLNVVKLPPLYKPTLIGQGAQTPKLFRPGVFEVYVQNGELVRGQSLSMPSDNNVFNFAWIPEGYKADDTAKLVTLSSNEQLLLYTPKGTRLFQSDEYYSGAVQGIEVNKAMPGMGRDDVTIGATYYIPMRMHVFSLGDDKYEVLVNKPISTAGRIFNRYRSFPESELHSLYWDGIGMTLAWKTRPIKGSVCDYTINDANNDGIIDLIACVNTHPGALGVDARKSMVVFYPLDESRMDPNASVYDNTLGYQ